MAFHLLEKVKSEAYPTPNTNMNLQMDQDLNTSLRRQKRWDGNLGLPVSLLCLPCMATPGTLLITLAWQMKGERHR